MLCVYPPLTSLFVPPASACVTLRVYMPPRRPRLVTLFAILFFGAGLYQALGVYAALTGWTLLNSLSLTVPPIYLPLRNGLLAVVFVAVGAGLWQSRRWGLRLTTTALPVVAAWAPIERVWLGRSEFAATSLPWTMVFSAVWLILTLVVVWRSRRFFF